MSSKDKEEKQKMEKGEEQLMAFIASNLDAFNTPRLSDIVAEGKKWGLSAKKSKSIARIHFEAYRDVARRPSFPWPAKKHRNYLAHFYGTLYVDLAFFGKRATELNRLGAVSKTEMNPALVAVDGVTHYAMAEALGPGGKSTKSVVSAMSKVFEKYKEQYNTYPFVLCSDKEKAIMSKEMKSFLDSKGTKLFAYAFSRTKALFAENLIRNLRSSMAMLRKRHGEGKFKWTIYLPKLIRAYNSRPLVHYGKKLSFSPDEITNETFDDYKNEIRKKIKIYSMASFSIYPGLFKWKHPLNSRVRLKRRAVEVPGIGSKWSQSPLVENSTFLVKRRVVHLNAKNELIKTLILQDEENSEVTTHQPESACVLVDYANFDAFSASSSSSSEKEEERRDKGEESE